MREIVIILDGASIHIEAIGFAGSSCEAATEDIERALGSLAERVYKPEYYVVEQAGDVWTRTS